MRIELLLYLQILNAYNHKNPLFFQSDYNYAVDVGDVRVDTSMRPVSVPTLPSIGVRFSF